MNRLTARTTTEVRSTNLDPKTSGVQLSTILVALEDFHEYETKLAALNEELFGQLWEPALRAA